MQLSALVFIEIMDAIILDFWLNKVTVAQIIRLEATFDDFSINRINDPK